MPYLAILLVLLCFLKTFYYGIYELKQKQNKSGGMAVCALAILRTHLSHCDYLHILYYLTILISAYF